MEHNNESRTLNKWTDTIVFIKQAPIAYIVTAPIIYGMVIPLAFLDLTLTLYQHICFRAYKIPLVNRNQYIIIDRHRLPYLNPIQKLNCAYCGYGNGMIAYAKEVLARTEQYWCPIKHLKKSIGQHKRSGKFVEYGNKKQWKEQLVEIRQDWD